METRKLIKSGPSTLVVALPKKWLQSNNLNKGDSIEVEILGGKLMISPLKSKKDITLYEINLDDNLKRYPELLLYAAFLSDKNSITIKNIKQGDFQYIIKILKKLTYLKIEERTADSLKLIFIVDPEIIDLKKELTRALFYIDNFFDCLLENKIEELELQEIYDQLVINVMLTIKMLKIKFLDYEKNKLFRYKQQIDSYYFLIKTCKEFLLFREKKSLDEELKEFIKEAITALKIMVISLEKDDLKNTLFTQETIQKRRQLIIQKIQKSTTKRNVMFYMLINDLYKIIENIGYSYINNR